MPAVKRANKKSKINLTGNKKRLAVLVFAFAVVGVAVLIRSFAATTVLSINLGDQLGTNPAIKAGDDSVKVVTESDTTQKKVTSKNYVELPQKYSNVSYESALSAGQYELCVSMKPTTVGAELFMSTGIDNGGSGLEESSSQLIGETTALPNLPLHPKVQLNTVKEVCKKFYISKANENKKLIMSLNSQNGSWRVSTLQVKLNSDKETSQKALIDSANNGKIMGYSISESIYPYGQITARFFDGKLDVLADTVNGSSQSIFQTSDGGGVEMQQHYLWGFVPNKTKTYRFCATVKALVPNNTSTYNLYSQSGPNISESSGSFSDFRTFTAVAADGNYTDKCIQLKPYPSGTIKGGISFYGPNKWSVANAWIEERPISY